MTKDSIRYIQPEQLGQIGSTSSWNADGVAPKTSLFLNRAYELGLFNQLDKRKKALIEAYFATNTTLEALKSEAGVTSRERVRQLIEKGMEVMWESLPEEIKQLYSKDVAIKLKSPFSPASRARMSEAHKQRWQDPEYRARMSEALKGKTRSPETRARMSEAQKGKTHSPETRARMSEALKRYWAERRVKKTL